MFWRILTLLVVSTTLVGAEPTVSGEWLNERPRFILKSMAEQTNSRVEFRGESQYDAESVRLQTVPFERALEMLQPHLHYTYEKLEDGRYLIDLGPVPEAPRRKVVSERDFSGLVYSRNFRRVSELLIRRPELANATINYGESSRSVLGRAAEIGSPRMIRILLRAGAVDQPKDTDSSAVKIAASRNHLGCLDYLLEQGHSLRSTEAGALFNFEQKSFDKLLTPQLARLVRDHSGGTLLHPYSFPYFLKKLHKEERKRYLEKLLALGVPVDAKNEHGDAALHQAIEQNDLEFVKLLLRSGSDPNLIGREGITPAMLAASQSPDMLEQLIGAGADIHGRDHGGRTTLHHAVLSGSVETCERLIDSGVEVNELTTIGQSPTFQARVQRKVEVEAYLASRGGTMLPAECEKVRDKTNNTILHVAASVGMLPEVKELIRRGAAMEVFDQGGETPLQRACRTVNLECVRALLDGGARISTEDADGDRALAYAAASNRVKIGELLLRRGAELDSQNKNGYTALHWAASRASPEFVELLVKSGARTDMLTKEGKTPLDLAQNIHSRNKVQRERILLLLSP